jgi:2-C-methyl-D-erythritol 4-phosphate cytidylyltransferase
MAVVGIVPAAGSGERLGASGPKAFALCGGRPLLEWSLEVLGAVCDRVVVAVPAGYADSPDRVVGGASRSESVRLALAAAPEASVAVVHDAARPLLTRALVEGCIEALSGWDGVVAAAPVPDTIKEADASGRVVRTLERSALWAIQTPQVFRADALRRALDVPTDVLATATDDAALVEAAGGSVRVFEAPADNIKVTRGVDLQLAESLLRSRAL